MRLPLEKWIDEVSLPDEAQIALKESVLAFKAGAYRASLLFGYLGWSLTLRHRLLVAKPPTGFVPAEWVTIQNELKNDDKWDLKVFDLTQMKTTKIVFNVSDDFRHQVRYWKDRRNDCAHLKRNVIDSAHVESFWCFMQSNLGRFIPSGSIGDLQDQIKRHFDPSYTAPGADIQPIINLLPHSISPGETIALLNGLNTLLIDPFGAAIVPEIVEVIEAILRLNLADFTVEVVRYLKANESLMLELTRKHQNRILLLMDDAALIRHLWHDLLFQGHNADLGLYATLLRNGAVPEAEIAEANEILVTRLSNDIPSPRDRELLERHGFIQALQHYVYDDYKINEFAWGNRNCNTIRWLIENHTITNDIARIISNVFGTRPYPNAVKASLKNLYDTNPNKKAEFLAALGALGVGHVDPFV